MSEAAIVHRAALEKRRSGWILWTKPVQLTEQAVDRLPESSELLGLAVLNRIRGFDRRIALASPVTRPSTMITPQSARSA